MCGVVMRSFNPNEFTLKSIKVLNTTNVEYIVSIDGVEMRFECEYFKGNSIGVSGIIFGKFDNYLFPVMKINNYVCRAIVEMTFDIITGRKEVIFPVDLLTAKDRLARLEDL